ncbi:hypothetical protein AALO_G00175440 [Alosa alosa]|uniref:C2H2-type domain-containing protein n=1 Tax=Alosa alosa TaxID=278164 RepID=A0AAV6G877_9TELE|nr:hypothetical protein AALO_G00175440 [Alosa alosa]
MAAEHTQNPDRVPNDPLINSRDVKNDAESGVSLREHDVSAKDFDNNAEAKENVQTDVDSGLVSHAESSTSLVDLESTVSTTETKKPSVVSSSLQLQMEWSDTEEDSGQPILNDCGGNALEADGADDVTPEPRKETVELSSGAETTLKRKVEPPQLQDDQAASEEVSKELHAEEPVALEKKGVGGGGGGEDEKRGGEDEKGGGEDEKGGGEDEKGGGEDEKGKTREEEKGGGEDEKKKEGEVEASEEGKVEEEVVVVKQRKSRLECRECGKCFTRRETYNLHRHFHMHQDEQASLTCKECGLTFQHRSSLIKHRNEHKEKEKAESVAPSVQASVSFSDRKALIKAKDTQNDPQCEYCGKTFDTLAKLRTHNCKLAPEKPYRCPLCRKEFQYRVSITAHMQTHSLESPFRCLECNKGFHSAMMLRIHQRSHAALKPFACPECGMVFRHRSVMEDHRRKHTDERPYHCNICGKFFKYASLLHQHQYLHTGKKPFRCRDCGKVFAFSQNLRAHLRQHQKHPHSCPHCLDTFSDEAKLQEHIATHELSHEASVVDKENANYAVEQPRLYNCPLCSQVYYRPADLRVHMLVHEAEYEGMSNGVKQSEPTYACAQCPLSFSDEASLQSHVITHEASFMRRDVRGGGLGMGRRESMPGSGIYGDQIDKKPLKCRDCGRGFRHRSVLELHMRIHSKDKPYRCNECGKSFRFGSYLQQHLIIHTGKKPYKCPDCGKDFAFLQNMRTHQRLHQQKPFRCTQCRKGYSDEDQLQRHMLSHTGDKPHKCHLCNKSFGLAYLLRDHMNTHTGERPHRCQECNKSFQWLSSLLVHQKIHTRKHQEGKRGRRGDSFRSDWQRWDRAPGTMMLTQPSTYAAPVSQGQDWQGRMPPPPQQSQSFARQSDPQELPMQQELWQPGIAVTQQSQKREPQRQPEPTVNTVHAPQQQQQHQQWQIERQTQPAQYGAPRFPHGDAPAVWGFQTAPGGSQTLLTGPIQQGTVRGQTQLPLMTGPQIIINQAPPFLSPALRPLPPLGLPAPHPLHSVAVNQISRPPPQNLFFNPQGIIGDRPPRPFAQIAPRTELPNLTGRLPFPTDRRQCVICGCAFAQELELQMHYMQHAKGEI